LELRLRVFENRVLTGILGSGREEVTGEWRKLHNEELHDLYSSPNIVRVMGGECNADRGGERHVQGFGGETCRKETTGETQT
jgi:hypothetical protein